MRQRPDIIRSTITLPAVFIIAGLMSTPSIGAPQDLIVSDFKSGGLTGWQEKTFSQPTRYELIDNGAEKVLKADSKASASGLYREMSIDLTKTPCLTWSWKVDRILSDLDETTKSGDDYPARVYVVFSGGLFFWRTRALNYVWSSTRPKGSDWPNAYTDRSILVAADSGPGKVGQWVKQSRNIRDDYKRLVGEDITRADAVAIMTDTDDSGQSATAYYRDLKFTPEC